jgi:hypothetical protein
MLFGTAWRPAHDEFPAPGLLPHDVPAGFLDGIRWPLRRWFLAPPAKRADLGPERA